MSDRSDRTVRSTFQDTFEDIFQDVRAYGAFLLLCCVIALNGCGGGGGAVTPTPPQEAVAKPTGIFAMTGLTTSDAEKETLLSLSYVTGMTSYVSWADIEPVKGKFDFSKLDGNIALARSHGKKITLGVFTGKNSIPDWVAGEGVKMWVTGQGNTLIHPADPAFLTLWKERVKVIGERYDNDSTVVLVTVCGPAGTLCGPRYPELPSDVTYAQLVSAWTQVAGFYMQAFPNTYKNLEVQLSANGYGADLPVDLFKTVAQDVKIGPFAEFLSDTAPTSTSVTGIAFAASAKGRDWCGFQMVGPLGDKVGAAVLRGRTFGCGYFEIYGADLKQQGNLLSML